jgi:hypothetical protein
MIVSQLNNNQSKKKAWMREGQWLWHIIHTDTFAVTDPTFGVMEPWFAGMATSFGNNDYKQCQQGPPQK